MKKLYSTPVATAEEFEANEYVASCYTIRCEIGNSANPLSPQEQMDLYGSAEFGSNINHGGSCGSADNDFIFSSDDTIAVGDQIFEMSSDQGKIYGTITAVRGSTVYWTTFSGNGDREWNHYGNVETVSPSHPNRS